MVEGDGYLNGDGLEIIIRHLQALKRLLAGRHDEGRFPPWVSW